MHGAGRYNTLVEQKNVAACILCGLGKYMDSTYLARLVESDCTYCPTGKYNDEPGLTGEATEISHRVSGCSLAHKCNLCEGSCSHDSECQTGLTCFHFGSTSISHVPGCSTTNLMLDRGYCHNASKATRWEIGGNVGERHRTYSTVFEF